MPTPIREAVLAAVAGRLAALLPDVPIERAQRAEPAVETMPCLILQGGDMIPDESQSPGECFWQVEFVVQGYAAGESDLAAEQALTAAPRRGGGSAAGLGSTVAVGAGHHLGFCL